MPSNKMHKDMPMQQLKTQFEDDDGYVYTENTVSQSSRTKDMKKKAANSRKFSVDVMNQLPSRQLDDLIVGSVSGEHDTGQGGLHSTTLKRRESRYKTLRLQSATINSRHMQVDADKIYELLTADMEMSEGEIKETLRDMYQSLTLKRIVKARFEREEERKNQLKQVHWQARLKYRIAMAWQQFKYSVRDLKYSLELWHGHVKTIQGHFGSGVASYFIFLRWLLYLNAVIFIIILSFIISPQFLYQAESNVAKENNNSISFTGYDLVTGSGWLTDSMLYYGHYTNETIEFVDGLPYNMPLAYLFTIGVCIVIYLFTLSYSLKKSYQQNYVDTSGDVKNIFANKVFSSWDYTIETVDAARLRSRRIYIELKEILSTEFKLHVEESWITKTFHTCVCITVNIFVASVMCGIGYLVYYILDIRAVNTNIPVLRKLTLALTVSAITYIFPFLFSFVSKMEWFYSKQTSFYLSMIRIMLLKIIILGVLVYFWVVLYDPNVGNLSCYETDLGEEIYRLVIVNFLATLLFHTILGEYLKRILAKNCCMYVEHPEFKIVYNTLDLIYYQTLMWVGIFYSPMLPLLLLIIFVLLFYVKRYSVTVNCRPALRPWYAAHAHTLFLALSFINFLLAAFVIGYIIFKISPSTGCGPFQLQKNYYDSFLALLGNTKERNLIIALVLKYATSPGVMAAVFTALCVAVYYSRSKAKAYEEIVQLIREQLILEGKDKVFLLKLFDSALQQKYQSAAENSDCAKPGPSHITDSSGFVEDCPVNKQLNKSELINQIYRDYSHHGCGKDSPISPVVIQEKFTPVYIPADVPANTQSPESSRENINQDITRSKWERQNTLSVIDQMSAKSPFKRGNSLVNATQNFKPDETEQSNYRSRDASPAKFVKGDLGLCIKSTRQPSIPFPYPVHQQGFQYLARGETPPRANQIFTDSNQTFLRK